MLTLFSPFYLYENSSRYSESSLLCETASDLDIICDILQPTWLTSSSYGFLLSLFFSLCLFFSQDGTQYACYVRPNESNLLLCHIAQSCSPPALPLFFLRLNSSTPPAASFVRRRFWPKFAASLCQYVCCKASCVCVIDPPHLPQPSCTNVRASPHRRLLSPVNLSRNAQELVLPFRLSSLKVPLSLRR